jgi:hypothetical protein
MADGVEAAQAVVLRRDMGPDPPSTGRRADAAGDVDWTLSVDSAVNRAHQHATNMRRVERPAGVHTGG